MRIDYNDIIPADGFAPIGEAARLVNRSERTIYDWIKHDGVRAFHEPRQPVMVNVPDILAIDKQRAQGRRRQPRPPTHPVEMLDTKPRRLQSET